MDPMVVAIGLGLLVSLVISERFGLSSGGMVVPGYLALSLHEPLAVGGTLLASLVTFGVVRLLSQHAIVYGRRRVAAAMVIGFLVGAAFNACLTGTLIAAGSTEFVVIGYVVPGLVALWFDRQGVLDTLSTSLSAGCAVWLLLVTCGVEVVS